jgi:hypothetical protein
MIARKALLGVVGAAAFAASTLLTAPAAEARVCKGYYTGEATGIFAATTGIAARADWRGQVNAREGSRFALWSRSRDRRTRCERRESGGRWFCQARARPCDER